MRYEWERPIPVAVPSDLPRLQLVTVQELRPICPVCGKPRRWARKYDSPKCRQKYWEQSGKQKSLANPPRG